MPRKVHIGFAVPRGWLKALADPRLRAVVPAAWRQPGMKITQSDVLRAMVMRLAQGYGVPLPLDDEDEIGAGGASQRSKAKRS